MFKGGFFSWLLSVLLAFGAGTAAGRHYEPNTDLEQQVSDHVDVIVDEMAGIVDDVNAAKEQRQSEWEAEMETDEDYRRAKEFVEDVREIADNTAADIEAHFGSGEEETEAVAEGGTEAAESVVEGETETVEEETVEAETEA